MFPGNIYQALEIIGSGKIVRIRSIPSKRVFMKIKEMNGEYNILSKSGFCNCQEYLSKCLNEQIYMCKHMLAASLGEFLDNVQEIKISDEEFGGRKKPSLL